MKETYSGVVRLIHCERTKIDLREVDSAKSDSRVYVSNQGLAN